MSEEGKQPESVEQSSGLNINASGDVTTGDHVARDKITHIYQVASPPPTPLTTDEPPAPGASPFKGLEYFNEADADLFFGREALTAKLVGHLHRHRFLAVVGASGSGKSSLVRAGLVPALKRGEPLADGVLPPDGSSRWSIHVITPTSHPLKALAASLTHDSESVTSTSTLMDDLANESRSLDLAVQRLLSRQAGAHLLIVVDQFEELFTLCRDETERQAFIDNLLTAVAPETDGPTLVVITLRADFYARCAQYADLRAALEKWQAYIGPMSAEELRRAIEEPAKRNGWEFEPGLVDLLLRDAGAGSEPGALPLLSHALLETWKRRSGRRLTLKGYAESGGVHGAIAKTAETVYQQLIPEQQTIARSIFLRLTELGEGTQDTRRRAALVELVPSSEDKTAVSAVLKTLADARLITIDEETAEVVHEALIREWPTLRRWLDEDREGLQIHHRLMEAAQGWAELERDPSELYRGGRLGAAIDWAKGHASELNALEREFLDASRALEVSELEAARKRLAQLRRWTLYLALALAIAIVTTIAAIFSGERANSTANSNATLAVQNAVIANTAQAASTHAVAESNSRATAEADAQQQARLAFSRQLAAQAISHLDNQLDLALLLGIEAYGIEHTAEARGSLLTGLQRSSHLMTFLQGHTYGVNSVAFSSDRKMLVSGNLNNTIALWDISNPSSPVQIGELLSGHTGPVNSVAFSPDGKTLASGSDDKTIILWDISNPSSPLPIGKPLSGHMDHVFSIAFSSDGKILASGSYDKTIRLWDISDLQSPVQLGTTLYGHLDAVSSVAFNLEGKILASGSWDKTVILWDISNPRSPIRLGRPLTGHTQAINSVVFSQDGNTLASASYNNINETDNAVILWDISNPQSPIQLQASLSSHIDWLSSMSFSLDVGMLTLSAENSTILWNASDFLSLVQLGAPISGHMDSVWSLAISPDGKTLASGSADKTIILWDISDPQSPVKLGVPLSGHTDWVSSLSISSDGRTLASGSLDKTIMLWDISNPNSPTQLGTPLSGHTKRVWSVALSPDGKLLASGGDDKTIILWDISKLHSPVKLGTPLLGHTESVWNLAFSPLGKTLASSGSFDKTIILWDISNPSSPTRLGMPLTSYTNAVDSVAFSPDGKTLVSVGDDKAIILWDISNPRSPVQIGELLSDYTRLVSNVAFSPNGKTLASGSFDKTITLWDISNPKSPVRLGMPLSGHTGGVLSVTFSPDGKTLVSGSEDKAIILWDVSVASWIARACRIVARNLTTTEWAQYMGAEPYHKTCEQWPEGK